MQRARQDSNLQPSDSKSATLSNWATGAIIRKFLKYNNFTHGLSTFSRSDFVNITKKDYFSVSLLCYWDSKRHVSYACTGLCMPADIRLLLCFFVPPYEIAISNSNTVWSPGDVPLWMFLVLQWFRFDFQTSHIRERPDQNILSLSLSLGRLLVHCWIFDCRRRARFSNIILLLLTNKLRNRRNRT